MATQLQAMPSVKRPGGLVLHKKSPKAKIAGGVNFDPVELDAALSQDAKKKERNGLGVVPTRNKEAAMGLLSKLCRTMKDLDLFDEFDMQLSQMIKRVKNLN